MKFSTTILRITPFSAVCSMATALAAVFLPSDFERLVLLSSVAGDTEEGARRFDALPSLLSGAADPAARDIAYLDAGLTAPLKADATDFARGDQNAPRLPPTPPLPDR